VLLASNLDGASQLDVPSIVRHLQTTRMMLLISSRMALPTHSASIIAGCRLRSATSRSRSLLLGRLTGLHSESSCSCCVPSGSKAGAAAGGAAAGGAAGPSSGCSVAIDATFSLARTLNGDRVRAPPQSGPCGLSSHFPPRKFRLLQSSCDCRGGSQHTFDHFIESQFGNQIHRRHSRSRQVLVMAIQKDRKPVFRGLRYATRNNLH
jgi:hypothetical protein